MKKAVLILLFLMFSTNIAIAKDIKQLTLSAERGVASAQRELGYCYYNGYDIPKNYKQAAYWFQKAAEQGDGSGQYMLGTCYEKGNGVPQNNKLAYMWFSISSTKFPDPSLVRYKLSGLENEMTKAQIEEAQEMAAKKYETLKK